MDKRQAAEQLRRAIQLFIATIGDEQALEVATVYPVYKIGLAYKKDDLLRYGTNGVGDPQLYRVVQDHTSAQEWPPDQTPALYNPIGLNADGYPIWAQPTGAHDAYNKGDIVEYKGDLYQSLIDGNVYAPDAYPAGWSLYSK